jgi:Na+/proline symporter
MKRDAMLALAAAILVVLATPQLTEAKCMTTPAVEKFFTDAAKVSEIPAPGSCCQMDVCGIPCPAEHPKPDGAFAIGIGIMVAFFCAIGIGAFYFVGGKAENFFVAGRSLPLFVVTMTLASQSIDSNALLGNADLSYKYHLFDGAVLPIGLGLSLIINGVALAHHINNEVVLTLPDIYGKRYGKLTEICASICTCVSFTCLLAGNLVGMSVILSYIFDISEMSAVFLSGIICLVYTACGGLFSVAYTDVVQSVIGMVGCLACAYWIINNADEKAPPPSIGMPKLNASAVAGMYVYPNDEIAKMYDAVPCEHDATLKCYNQQKWCPSATDCKADNGAYPLGDKQIFDNQMTDPYSLTPFPNAIFWNWATIFILAFGNLAALDFQARCMAAKSPLHARIGCIIGGCLTFFVGIPFAYLGAITRYYYGPDSPYAEFEADSCSKILDLPQCAMWMPDPKAFIKLLTTLPPGFLGGWGLLGIVAASMSTSDGAILALGTVFSHNIMRHFTGLSDKNLLLVSRLATIPFAFCAMLIAAFYQSSHSAGATGYLLIVAFDVVLAGCIVPLFACFYVDKPSPNAALFSVVGGTLARIILEFSLPKDGFLLLPYSKDEFLNYGTPMQDLFPGWFDVPNTDKWDSSTCKQERFKDYTGVDSLAAPLVSFVLFVVIHYAEKMKGSPLFNLAPALMTPYTKEGASENEVTDKL